MKHKFSKLAIGLAAVCAFSGQANAALTLSGGSLTFASNGDGTYSAAIPYTNVPNNPGVATTWTDTFNFVLAPSPSGPIEATASISSSKLTFASSNALQIYDVNTSSFVPLTAITSTAHSADYTSTVSLSSDDLYHLIVSGNAAKNSNAVFNGNLTISPVPEPTEGALLLSGLALFGFIAARRGRNEA